MTASELKAEAIKKGMAEIGEAAARTHIATGARDLFVTVEKHLPVGVQSLKDIETQLNDCEKIPYQTVLQLVDRWVDGWKSCFARFLRIKNANDQLAAELETRRKTPGAGRKRG